MFQGLTENSNRIINYLAPIEMKRFKHKVVQPEHILVSLLKDASEKVFAMLDEIIDMVHFQCILESHMNKTNDEEAISSKNILVYYNINIEPAISQRTKKVILQAMDESRNYNQNILDSFSIFLACCADKQSIANVILMRHQLALDDFRKHYKKFLNESDNTTNNKQQSNSHENIENNVQEIDAYETNAPEEFALSLQRDKRGVKAKHEERKVIFEKESSNNSNTKKAEELYKYCVDITKKSYEEKNSIIHGRDDEIEKIFRVLLRKQKNNPLLVGDAGVGKTAIVEELARRIVCGDAPLSLLDSRILELNLTALTAGTRYRGDFEERFMHVLNEIVHQSKKRKIFLFIDEFHHIIGTGLAAGLTMDAAGILKPALARGTISCIGATTFEEYRKHIEIDRAFQRRMQIIEIQEMSQEATIHALQQIKKSYEEKHNVSFSMEAIEELVRLSSHHFFDRKLPDKAIDILDETGSYISLHKVKVSKELKQLIEEENSLISIIRNNTQQQSSLHIKSKKRKQQVESTYDEGDSNDECVNEQTQRINKFYAITRKRKELQQKLITSFANKQTKVHAKQVREVVSKITGINQDSLQSKNIALLNNFEGKLKQHIIGQDEAVKSVMSSVSRGILRILNSHQPMGSFIFLGPSGVGKTFTAKQLAMQLYGIKEAFTRFDMTDYSESNSITRLVGSPPGYIGYEESGILIKSVRRQPRQILLFDEIEKAHPRVYDIFLQILEEGTLQGQKGEVADFRHCIIIFTSNIGSKEILQSQSIGFSEKSLDNDTVKTMVMQELKKIFRPELLNRFNDIVVFNLLEKEQVLRIIHNVLDTFTTDIEKHKIFVQIDRNVIDFLFDTYYKKEYGVRSIMKGIREIEDHITDSILKSEVKEGSHITLSVRSGSFTISSRHKPRLLSRRNKKSSKRMIEDKKLVSQ